jgi:hypothetical protein
VCPDLFGGKENQTRLFLKPLSQSAAFPSSSYGGDQKMRAFSCSYLREKIHQRPINQETTTKKKKRGRKETKQERERNKNKKRNNET